MTDIPWEIGSMIAGLAAAAGLIVALWQDRNARYLEFIKDMDAELSGHLEKEEKLEKYEQCITYAYNYIDILERVAFLMQNGKIPKKFGEYYRDFFNYAATMMWWYTTYYDDKHSPKESWPSLIRWLKAHEMNPYLMDHLPKIMQNALKKTNESKEKIEESKDEVNMTPKEIYDSLMTNIDKGMRSESSKTK